MKIKCPKCGTGKARRICQREGNAEICSQCCASIRSTECGDCVHYESTWNYEARRAASTGVLPVGDFIIELNPEITAAVNKTLESAERGGARKAKATLTEMLREHPRNHEVIFGIGCVHAIQAQHKKAIEWFDKAIAIYPYSVESYYNKAVAYQKMMDLPNCIRCHQKVAAMGDPADPEVAESLLFITEFSTSVSKRMGISLNSFMESNDHFERAFSHMDAGEWQKALEGFQASAAINDKNASSHGNMGLCHAYLGRKAMALAELDRALEIDPSYQPARDNRKLVEKTKEGTPMENVAFKSINYGLEKFKAGSQYGEGV